MRRFWFGITIVGLLFLAAGCAVEPYGGTYGGVYGEYPGYGYGAYQPGYAYPYYYNGYAPYGGHWAPYDRDHYWDRGHHWDRHRYPYNRYDWH